MTCVPVEICQPVTEPSRRSSREKPAVVYDENAMEVDRLLEEEEEEEKREGEEGGRGGRKKKSTKKKQVRRDARRT